jgi:hypothetical protein
VSANGRYITTGKSAKGAIQNGFSLEGYARTAGQCRRQMTQPDADVPETNDKDTQTRAGPATGKRSVRRAPYRVAEAVASFAASMIRFAASGFKTVDESLHELRMSRCSQCEHRKETQCALCRCYIDKKAWLPHEDCPIGKWPS